MKHPTSPLTSLRALCGACLLLGMASLSTAAHAGNADTDQPTAQQPEPLIANGEESRVWLKLQDAGTQSSKHKQTIGGQAMSLIYGRYLESFKKPIHGNNGGSTSSQTNTK